MSDERAGTLWVEVDRLPNELRPGAVITALHRCRFFRRLRAARDENVPVTVHANDKPAETLAVYAAVLGANPEDVRVELPDGNVDTLPVRLPDVRYEPDVDATWSLIEPLPNSPADAVRTLHHALRRNEMGSLPAVRFEDGRIVDLETIRQHAATETRRPTLTEVEMFRPGLDTSVEGAAVVLDGAPFVPPPPFTHDRDDTPDPPDEPAPKDGKLTQAQQAAPATNATGIGSWLTIGGLGLTAIGLLTWALVTAFPELVAGGEPAEAHPMGALERGAYEAFGQLPVPEPDRVPGQAQSDEGAWLDPGWYEAVVNDLPLTFELTERLYVWVSGHSGEPGTEHLSVADTAPEDAEETAVITSATVSSAIGHVQVPDPPFEGDDHYELVHGPPADPEAFLTEHPLMRADNAQQVQLAGRDAIRVRFLAADKDASLQMFGEEPPFLRLFLVAYDSTDEARHLLRGPHVETGPHYMFLLTVERPRGNWGPMMTVRIGDSASDEEFSLADWQQHFLDTLDF